MQKFFLHGSSWPDRCMMLQLHVRDIATSSSMQLAGYIREHLHALAHHQVHTTPQDRTRKLHCKMRMPSVVRVRVRVREPLQFESYILLLWFAP